MSNETLGLRHAYDKFVAPAEGKSHCFSRLSQLTPVEQQGHLFFKRDDLFRPFGTGTLNGGKLRAVMTILRDCRLPGVITAASIYSPQIPLVAGAAHCLGLRCVAIVGGKTMTDELRIASELGANIRRAASGRHRALFAEVSRINADLGFHVIPYGIAPQSCPREFFMTQSQQVANLPDELDILVVTCGSGVSTVGILMGLWRFSKSVRELILVTTAPPRLKRISGYLQAVCPEAGQFLDTIKVTHIDLFGASGFRYERKIPFTLCGIQLHPRYEAKAFRHVLETRDCTSRRTLFWIIGADLRELDEGEAA